MGKYQTFEMRDLQADQLDFSGGLTAPVPVAASGSVTVEFDGLGTIEVRGA